MVLEGDEAWLRKWSDPLAMVLFAIFIASAVSGSLLVTGTPGDLIVIVPVGVLFVLGMRRVDRRAPLAHLGRPVACIIAGYVAVSALTVVVSLSRSTSLKYLVGSAVVIAVGFVVLPTLAPVGLSDVISWMTFLVGIVMAVAAFVVGVFGPVSVHGEEVGRYLPVDVVIFGHSSPFTVPLVTGIYGTPGNQAIGLACALICGAFLLGRMRPRSRLRWWSLVGLALIAACLALSFSRTGWLVVCFGLFVPSLAGAVRRRMVWFTVVPMVFFALLASLLLLDKLTVNARYDVFADRYGLDAAEKVISSTHAVTSLNVSSGGAVGQASTVVVKGGADSSSRRIIWSASVGAIKDRPALGYGLGMDATAIEPKLVGSAAVYKGLTSHSTWLRTTVEGGVALGLLLVLLETALLLRIARSVFDRRWPWDSAVFGPAGLSVALVPALFTETLLLGGLTFLSVVWTLSAGCLLAVARSPLYAEPRSATAHVARRHDVGDERSEISTSNLDSTV